MAKSYQKNKGRRSGKRYFPKYHDVQKSPAYRSLTLSARAVLDDLCLQLNGKNNGDLALAMRLMKPLGWTSHNTLTRAAKELKDKGFLTLTRQGGRGIPNLFAITWAPINDCGGKLEVMPTIVASNLWKKYDPTTGMIIDEN